MDKDHNRKQHVDHVSFILERDDIGYEEEIDPKKNKELLSRDIRRTESLEGKMKEKKKKKREQFVFRVLK